MNEKWRKEEVHWSMTTKSLRVRRIQPRMIDCKPVNPLEPTHQFQAIKVYLLNEQGHETAVVICPKHLQPISVEAVRPGLQGGQK